MNEREVVDVMVLLDGKNSPFFSYMNCDQAYEIQAVGGLSHAESVNLRETEDRPVPNILKEGTAFITDVLVKLQSAVVYNLN